MNASSSKHSLKLLALLLLALPIPGAAGEAASPGDSITVSGSLTALSQYRLRGVSFSDEKPVLQGSLTVSHASGFYAGLWASRLDGYGSFGGADIELDAIGGYVATIGDATLDGGLIWYSFPGTSGHGYAEIHASISHPLGPVGARLGINYAPKRKSIGNADNLHTYADFALPIDGTPVSLKAHVGYTTGKGSIYSGPRGHYLDYSVGAELSWRALSFGVAYVGTDIDRRAATDYYTVPGGKDGRELVEGAWEFSVSAAF